MDFTSFEGIALALYKVIMPFNVWAQNSKESQKLSSKAMANFQFIGEITCVPSPTLPVDIFMLFLVSWEVQNCAVLER